MTDTPVIGVLALQGDVREHLIALASADAVARPVRRPEELAGVDGLVIPGGESTTMSKLAVLFGMLEPLRERVAAGMPVYGTCGKHDPAGRQDPRSALRPGDGRRHRHDRAP